MANTSIDSNFGPRAQSYYKAAEKMKGYLHNSDGRVNKANMEAVKQTLPPVQAAPKKHAQVGGGDTVALSSEATESGSDSNSVRNFAAAWG